MFLDNDRHTIHWAAMHNDTDLMESLLESGVNPNIKNEDEETAFHWVSRNNNVKLAQILLEAGADPNVKNKYQATALDVAIEEDSVDVARFFMDKVLVGKDRKFMDNISDKMRSIIFPEDSAPGKSPSSGNIGEKEKKSHNCILS